jgi:hypothetical protein
LKGRLSAVPGRPYHARDSKARAPWHAMVPDRRRAFHGVVIKRDPFDLPPAMKREWTLAVGKPAKAPGVRDASRTLLLSWCLVRAFCVCAFMQQRLKCVACLVTAGAQLTREHEAGTPRPDAQQHSDGCAHARVWCSRQCSRVIDAGPHARGW